MEKKNCAKRRKAAGAGPTEDCDTVGAFLIHRRVRLRRRLSLRRPLLLQRAPPLGLLTLLLLGVVVKTAVDDRNAVVVYVIVIMPIIGNSEGATGGAAAGFAVGRGRRGTSVARTAQPPVAAPALSFRRRGSHQHTPAPASQAGGVVPRARRGKACSLVRQNTLGAKVSETSAAGRLPPPPIWRLLTSSATTTPFSVRKVLLITAAG